MVRTRCCPLLFRDACCSDNLNLSLDLSLDLSATVKSPLLHITHANAVSELSIMYKMYIARAVARHCMSKSLCLIGRIHNGPPRKGLLKYVDLAENRDGSVGGGFLTSLLRKAKNSREVREIVDEAVRRFEGTIPWQLLSAAAHVSAGPSVDDPQLAGTLLASISPRTSLTSGKGSLGQYSETHQGTRMVQWRSTPFASSRPETLP